MDEGLTTIEACARLKITKKTLAKWRKRYAHRFSDPEPKPTPAGNRYSRRAIDDWRASRAVLPPGPV